MKFKIGDKVEVVECYWRKHDGMIGIVSRLPNKYDNEYFVSNVSNNCTFASKVRLINPKKTKSGLINKHQPISKKKVSKKCNTYRPDMIGRCLVCRLFHFQKLSKRDAEILGGKPCKTPTKKQLLKAKYLEAKREWKDAMKLYRQTFKFAIKRALALQEAEQKYKEFKESK